ncbi:MAG: hypothetical protein QOC83_2959, partial [Pseudonocardiales bacterium]|nr:hypothetical protein [Pseudonocardiales bacterium]
LALGYADQHHRLNHYRTTREPVRDFTTFHGDEPAGSQVSPA